MKIVVKQPGKGIEVKELVLKGDELEGAWQANLKVREIIDSHDTLNDIKIGEICLAVGDEPADLNFILKGEPDTEEVRGITVFCKPTIVEGFGRSFKGLTEREINAIAEAFNKLKAQDEKGNILPVFCIRTFFESQLNK